MLVVLTDAEPDSETLDRALRAPRAPPSARRLRRLHVDQRHRAAADLRGRCGRPQYAEFAEAVRAVCDDLGQQLIQDAEGAGEDIKIEVVNAASEDDAVEVGRSIARNNLLKCAIHGEDPNWGRVLSAIGTTGAAFEPDQLNVAINGVWVCKNGGVGETSRARRHALPRGPHRRRPRHGALRDRHDLNNDLTADYVHENSAYSS